MNEGGEGRARRGTCRETPSPCEWAGVNHLGISLFPLLWDFMGLGGYLSSYSVLTSWLRSAVFPMGKGGTEGSVWPRQGEWCWVLTLRVQIAGFVL